MSEREPWVVSGIEGSCVFYSRRVPADDAPMEKKICRASDLEDEYDFFVAKASASRDAADRAWEDVRRLMRKKRK